VHRLLTASHFTPLGDLTIWQALGLTLPTMLLLIGNQGMYQKFFSARSEKDARRAVGGWIIGTLILETLLITLAVVGSSAFHPDNPREILLGGIFAKVISTANNYLFSPASNLIHDVYQRFVAKKGADRTSLVLSRITVVALGLFALGQAAHFESILRAALYAYTVYGAAVTPAVLAVFFSRRVNTAGAITSIASGTLVTVLWNLAGITALDAVYPALAMSVSCLFAASWMTAPPPEEKWRPFFE
jgi:SSS family solute:Na+ symporter/sodium/proline symporter